MQGVWGCSVPCLEPWAALTVHRSAGVQLSPLGFRPDVFMHAAAMGLAGRSPCGGGRRAQRRMLTFLVFSLPNLGSPVFIK